MLPYVTSFRRSMGTLLYSMKLIVSVPLILPPTPWASRPISLEKECAHSLLYLGCLIKCRYSIDAPVSGLIIMFAHCCIMYRLSSVGVTLLALFCRYNFAAVGVTCSTWLASSCVCEMTFRVRYLCVGAVVGAASTSSEVFAFLVLAPSEVSEELVGCSLGICRVLAF
jgi:hypothetical protein